MIPLIILILSIVALIASIFLINNTDHNIIWNDIGSIMLVVAMLTTTLAGLVTSQYSETQKYYPVAYKVASSNTYISVVTDYGVFDSTKIEDMNNWTQNKQGFIMVNYNVFGIECQKNSFVVDNDPNN